MSKILEKIESNLIEALKGKDENTSSVLRMLKSSIKNKEIELKREVTDEEVIEITSKEAKKRKDSISAYNDGGREDLAQKEEKEYAILATYLPEQMSEDEVKKIISKVVADNSFTQADFGKAMGMAMGQLKGKADGNIVGKVLKEVLK